MKRLILCFVFAPVTIFSHAQIVIKGKVLGSKSNLPVANASVYLNNTSAGTTTNSNGEFSLSVNNVYTGELIISSVGYQPLSTLVSNLHTGQKSDTFKLELKENLLKNVVVMNDAARQAWLKIFRENFLGITQEGDECKVANLDAVYFTAGENKSSFYAYADTPLVIVNEMSGYTISFDLVEFSYDKSLNSTSFLGYSRYEDMGDKKKWKKNRKENYFGSTMHFYRSLMANRLKQEGFTVYEIRKQKSGKDSSAKKGAISFGNYAVAIKVTATDILIKDSATGKYYLQSPDQLMIQYDQVPHSKYYLERKILVRGLNRFGFTAYITLLADKAEIDSNGIVHNPLALIYDGFWVYEKLANQLPFDYTPQ